MYHLNGEPLKLDRAFSDAEGNQYPSNWLRHATEEQRTAIGITYTPDPTPTYYDKRFYHSPNTPKDVALIKEQFTKQWNTEARSMLSATDWMVVRGVENPGRPVPSEITSEREAIRDASNDRITAINACTTIEEIQAYVNSVPAWPVGEEV